MPSDLLIEKSDDGAEPAGEHHSLGTVDLTVEDVHDTMGDSLKDVAGVPLELGEVRVTQGHRGWAAKSKENSDVAGWDVVLLSKGSAVVEPAAAVFFGHALTLTGLREVAQGLERMLALSYIGCMKKLISSYDRGLMRVLIARLKDEAIEHLVKDESASSMGEVTPISACQHLWIVHEGDQQRAEQLLKVLEEASIPAGGTWTCTACGEVLEAQFTECWQCGSERPREG